MRKIDRYNYEEFFLDYLEGNLSDSVVKNLENFLSQHPDLKEELDEMCLIEMHEEKVEFDKTALKQIPFENDFDEFCVAKLEGDLGEQEEIDFNNYLNENLIGKGQYQLYEKTKLHADFDIVYPEKEELKRKDRKLIPYWLLSGVGVAASVLILFSVWNTSMPEESAEETSSNKVAYIDSVNKAKIQPTDIPEKENQLVVEENNNNQLKEDIKTVIIENRTVDKLVAETKTAPIASVEPNQELNKPDLNEETSAKEISKVSLPNVANNAEVEVLANAELTDDQLDVRSEEIETVPVNSGLANLGMSWKSSVPKKKKKNLLYAVAKVGVDKLGEIAGKKVQLEKQYDSETEKTRLNFNTKGIGFSTSIK